ncbi:MAG: sulfotransferase [Deltaproteobacteria bacterium]|nr:sulfotransferase [Deltaproteobacteria bacterium]
MKVEKPIFIVGVGRSGSTVFHRIFSEHPNVAWLSYLCERFPNKPSRLSIIMKMVDYPVIGDFIGRKFGPGEGYPFWEYYCKGFSEPCRDLLAQDVTNKVKEKIPSVMSEILTTPRNRLLIKITGWPRIGFLHAIFNDAKFIHVKRDRRAVINSMITVRFWSGWRGPQNWRWGELTPAQIEEWERFDRSFIALAGIELKILAEAMEKAKRFVHNGNFMEVKYEDLCADSIDVFKKVTEFCELEWSPKFENSVKKYSLKNTNYKWKQELTGSQQEIIKYFVDGC